MSQQAVSDLIGQGMPATVAGRGKPRMIHIRTAVEWLTNRAVERVTTSDGAETKDQAALRKARADADMAEMKAGKLHAELVPVAVGTEVQRACLAAFDAAATAMIDKLPPLLADTAHTGTIRALVFEAARDARSAMGAEFEARA